MAPKLKAVLVIIAVIFPLDQLTKLWVVMNVSPFDPIRVIDGFFSITHARNPGMALGLAQDVPVYVFVVLTLVALGLIISYYRKCGDDDVFTAISLGLILSGALGNLLDRIVHGEVVDFLQFDLGHFVFPDFNVADSAIVVGVALLMLDLSTTRTEEDLGEGPETQ